MHAIMTEREVAYRDDGEEVSRLMPYATALTTDSPIDSQPTSTTYTSQPSPLTPAALHLSKFSIVFMPSFCYNENSIALKGAISMVVMPISTVMTELRSLFDELRESL